MNDNKDRNTKLDWLSIAIIVLSGVMIIFSFFAPRLFVQESKNGIDFSQTGEIGDTIGGIMNPFIAIAGVLLTFLAFYIQFQANKLQRTLFRQELDSNKFENQFYEMLRLHKDNVNEISITLKSSYYSGKEIVRNETQVNGRSVFKYFLYEMIILYNVAKKIFVDEKKESWLSTAYNTFFHGLDYIKNQPYDNTTSKYIEELERFQHVKNETEFNNILLKYKIKLEWNNYKLFIGHSVLLAHYYRHLFQTVKFVVNQPDKFIDYSAKRNYLRILRAQLANQEQAMLFYNWMAGFGWTWENEKNKFFTDYRMIHNLYKRKGFVGAKRTR